MRFAELFKSFSKRNAGATPPRKALTAAFRNRVLMRCRDVFGRSGLLEDFWPQIHSRLTYLHGSPVLRPYSDGSRLGVDEDTVRFVSTCSDAQFLDFVEFTFGLDATLGIDKDSLVEDFNAFLREDDLPYFVTPYVWTKGKTMLHGREYEGTTLTGYPQVIRKDSDLVHAKAVEPALRILNDPRFKEANKEMLGALKDYRGASFGDCLTKCGSAFESVLKVICAERGWAYTDKDTAGPLLNTVISQSGLEGFLDQPLMIVATLRNRLSTAHGAGTTTRAATEAKAEFAINATASAIVFLTRSTL